MAQISVKTGSLVAQEVNLLAVATKLRLIEAELDLLKSQINANQSSSAYRSVVRKINSTKSTIGQHRTSVTSMRNSLTQIRRIYNNTEKAVDADFHEKSSVNWNTISKPEARIDWSRYRWTPWIPWIPSNPGDRFKELQNIIDEMNEKHPGCSSASGTDSWSSWKGWITTDKWNSNWDSFWKDIKEDGKFEDSMMEAAAGFSGAIFGQEISGQITSKILNVEAKDKHVVKWDMDEGEIAAVREASVSGTGAKIGVEGQYGILSSESSASALTGAVSGEAGFVLAKDGKFQPSVTAGAKANGSVVSGQSGYKIGTDDLNHYGEAKGDLVGGEAKIGVSAGKGGVKAEAGAEAYLAKGEVKGGVEFAGIKIEATVEGKAGAVGAKAGGSVTGNAAEGEIGGSLGLGAGVKVKVDWSGAAKKIEKAWDNRPKWLFR